MFCLEKCLILCSDPTADLLSYLSSACIFLRIFQPNSACSQLKSSFYPNNFLFPTSFWWECRHSLRHPNSSTQSYLTPILHVSKLKTITYCSCLQTHALWHRNPDFKFQIGPREVILHGTLALMRGCAVNNIIYTPTGVILGFLDSLMCSRT